MHSGCRLYKNCTSVVLQMMQNLALEEGEIVNLKSASLPKGTYVKLQPHTTDFIDITNPKAVLETTLRNFSCLTVGDQITINYNNRQYFIDIVEAKPRAAISVIETDCEVDFAPPLDYVEPTRPEPTPAPVQEHPAGQSCHLALLVKALDSCAIPTLHPTCSVPLSRPKIITIDTPSHA